MDEKDVIIQDLRRELATERDKTRWRSVKDEPPKRFVDVYGYWSDTGKTAITYATNFDSPGGEWWVGDGFCGKLLTEPGPSHWMPIPAAPPRQTVYIAGKITGDADYMAKFQRAADRLQTLGYIPVSPTILPEGCFSYEAYMRMTGAMLRECAAICMLPDWRESPGAMTEHTMARNLGKVILAFDEQMEGVSEV